MIFTLTRKAETSVSTWGELRDPAGALMCKILERGAKNPDHVRIPAALYLISRKPVGTSEFDHDFGRLVGPNYKGILWLPNVPDATAPGGKRTNIEMHTANFIEQLLGCLATGDAIEPDGSRAFAIAGGTSRPAYARIYPVISGAIDAGLAQLKIIDIPSQMAAAA